MVQKTPANGLAPGTKLRELLIREPIGGGGSGIVYLADHTLLGATYVLKEFLPADLAQRLDDGQVAPQPGKEAQFEHLRKKFLQESRMLQELARPRPHPNLVIVADAFQENGTVYLCMVYEASNTLEDFLASRPQLDEARISAWLFPLLDGLAHAHARQIWHRDIKPSNILLRDDDSPLLIDFGAARWVHPDSEQTLIRQLTPQFAAPEQVLRHGEVGPWTDVYGMAATWYYALTGQSPMQRPLTKDWQAPYLERFSPRFLDALDAGLTSDISERPPSIAAWLRLFGVEPATPAAFGLGPAPSAAVKPRKNPTWGMDTEAITQQFAPEAELDAFDQPVAALHCSPESVIAPPAGPEASVGWNDQQPQPRRWPLWLALGLAVILLIILGLALLLF
ncbi:serine/threonine protein kinase [Rhabdochromatium marinum]|uniref:serine/threonine protein kinase n=1 Tax=Rhabdochromatium marinum TaxID=48729 RepID=UPI00190655B5|nr:serine/threonine-protein kinase [Rhabdochromatium marinum]